MLGLGNTLSGGIVPAAAGYTNTYSLDFDGTNDHLLSGSDLSFAHSSGGTVAYWQKTQFIGSEEEGDANFIAFHCSTFQFYIYTSWNGTNHRTYVVHPATGSFYGDDDVADEEWHHIALTIDGGGSGTENVGTIYVDGVVDATVTKTATYSEAQVKGAIKFGGNFSSSYFLDGNLDELGVWNSALTSTEIVQIYNSGAPIDLTEDSGNYESSSDLIHYYRCGDGDTYPTIEDRAGSNDLTMTNMASGDIVEVVPSA